MSSIPAASAGWPAPPRSAPISSACSAVLATARQDWEGLAGAVAPSTSPATRTRSCSTSSACIPHRSSSTSAMRRGFAYLFNRMKYDGLGARLLDAVNSRGLEEPAMQLLRRLGYQGDSTPEGLQRFFFSRAQSLNGPVIDDRPLSESDPVRAYAAGGRNYLEWAARGRPPIVRGPAAGARFHRTSVAPNALLYVVLRHALLLGYWDSALRLHVENGVVDAIGARRPGPSQRRSMSRRSALRARKVATRLLYSRDARVSGDAAVTVGERIRTEIGQDHAADASRGPALGARPHQGHSDRAARTLFRRALDTASYRLDSWLLGLVHLNLASMRYADGSGPDGRRPAEVDNPPRSLSRGVRLARKSAAQGAARNG